MRAIALLASITVAALIGGCVTTRGRFPTEVQASIARSSMKRLETDRLVIFYPANRRELTIRLADRLERCADTLYELARIDNRHAREKLFVVVPDTQFNNAYALPPVAGLQDTAVIPAVNTFDYTTEIGELPDPGAIGCHELTHYVQFKQIGGLWSGVRTVFGDVLTPQLGLDPWFLEGLASYYETRMQPGIGRARWPVFTGMFGAAYAGGKLGPSDLSEYKRAAVQGNHYQVGTMFIAFLAEKYGDPALWRLVELQARSASVVLSVDGRFAEVYGKGLGDLFREFRAWTAERFPVRPRPVGEQLVRSLGADARWAWSDSGAVAVIDNDLDRDTTLTVWEADGSVRAKLKLVDLTPPRKLTVADPQLVSGMSFTADGRDLFFTAIDRATTYQTTRLFRLRDRTLTELATGLGPGGAISPDGKRYYHLIADGDRWSLGVYDLATHGRAILWTAEPGQYALTVQPSPDGRRLAISGWNGRRFVIWMHDAESGARTGELANTGDRPLYDAAFGPANKVVCLDVVDGRFQVSFGSFEGKRKVVTDTAYGALAPRVVGDRLRYLAREGNHWDLVETPLPGAAKGVIQQDAPQPGETASFVRDGVHVESAPAPIRAARVLKEGDYRLGEGLFSLEERGVALRISDPTYAAGLSLGGRDRLDLVRWVAGGTVDVRNGDLSGAAGIELGVTAPWTVAAYASDSHYRETLDGGVELQHHDRDALVQLSRTWRDTYGFAIDGAYRSADDGLQPRKLWGPEAELDYVAVDGSPKVGVDRGVVATLSGGYYPRKTLDDLIHGRASLDLYEPLGFGRRHVLHLGGRADTTFGDNRALVEVGGVEPLSVLWSKPDTDPDHHTATVIDPSGDPFREPLRGFEDLPIPGYRAALVDLDWNYPLILDRGVTHLAFLPASFVRELDLQAFGSAAWVQYDDIDAHLAVGGALTFRMNLLRVPVALRYQLSRRLTDGDGVLHLLALSFE
ncbi:MAG TPA: hypothetical protein VHE35_28835 [Kofleriaceae bacterium]|nr:hypothetical protein [Kofleriaceae bacterium]